MNIVAPSRTDPALLQLEAEYAKLNLFDQSLWKTFADGIDIARFRGEHAYLAQMWGGMTEQRYRKSYEYMRKHANDVRLALSVDDNAFGVVGFEIGAVGYITRDLLDSISEIQFLVDTLGLRMQDYVPLLDIGAGYGRFIHHFLRAFPKSPAWGVDAVPLSTYLCEFYLNYRGIRDAVIPLHRLHDYLVPGLSLGLACNIYSFSEMPLSAVNFWLDLCADLNIPYFFLVPHAPDLIHPHFITSEPDGSHLDYMQAFERHGYRVETRRQKFPVEMSDQLIYNTEYILFSRK